MSFEGWNSHIVSCWFPAQKETLNMGYTLKPGTPSWWPWTMCSVWVYFESHPLESTFSKTRWFSGLPRRHCIELSFTVIFCRPIVSSCFFMFLHLSPLSFSFSCSWSCSFSSLSPPPLPLPSSPSLSLCLPVCLSVCLCVFLSDGRCADAAAHPPGGSLAGHRSPRRQRRFGLPRKTRGDEEGFPWWVCRVSWVLKGHQKAKPHFLWIPSKNSHPCVLGEFHGIDPTPVVRQEYVEAEPYDMTPGCSFSLICRCCGR